MFVGAALMSSLFGTMSLAAGAMMAQQSAIAVTANNVSNINTPGYSRQRADLAESPAAFDGSHMFGTGVVLQQVVSLRDRILELRIQDELQQQGSLKAQVESLADVELQFSMQNANVGDALNDFFDSLSSLSSLPSSQALRQSVLISAQNLANQFRSGSNMLTQRQFSLDLEVQQVVAQVNCDIAQIAKLNGQIAASNIPEDQLGTYVDERNALLQDLSSLMGNHVITADDGLTITAQDGTPLVVGTNVYDLAVVQDASGSTQLTAAGRLLDAQTVGGKIGGLLQVREQVIPGILQGLDSLASALITKFNSIHKNGVDLNGNAGTDFFIPVPNTGSGAAASFTVNITDADQIAASSDGSAGSNGNLNSLIDLRNQPLVNGDRLIDAYSHLTFQVGSSLANAKTDLQTSEAMVQQLKDQRGAISGVSLDEEASNLIRYQRAYEAAARVLTIISELTEVSVNLGR
jgi:flagellar hook-associated protein 1 FlgK